MNIFSQIIMKKKVIKLNKQLFEEEHNAGNRMIMNQIQEKLKKCLQIKRNSEGKKQV